MFECSTLPKTVPFHLTLHLAPHKSPSLVSRPVGLLELAPDKKFQVDLQDHRKAMIVVI